MKKKLQSSLQFICCGAFFAKIVNVLSSSAVFVEELHCGCLTGLSIRLYLITYYSTKKV